LDKVGKTQIINNLSKKIKKEEVNSNDSERGITNIIINTKQTESNSTTSKIKNSVGFIEDNKFYRSRSDVSIHSRGMSCHSRPRA
jgi:hypothetical protein